MRRTPVRDDAAEGAFLEKLEIFQQNPELLGKYLIGRKVTLDVLDLFLARLFGSEGLSGVADVKEAVESVLGDSLDSLRVEEKSSEVSEKSPGSSDEHWAVVEELQQQVLDLTRQFSALQRQLQMQGEVSQMATSLKSRLDEVTSACKRRTAETDEALRAEIRKVNAISRDISSNLEELKGDLGLKASAEDFLELKAEVARLKEAEQGLDGRISAVDASASNSERVLREEIQGKIDLKDDPLDGIIAHLTRACGGNVHKEGVINVTGSSFCCGREPENAVDLWSDSSFSSKNSPNSWICYDFGGRRVIPESYSIRSFGGRPGKAHPKSWVLEASNDGMNGSWVVVDSRKDNFDLNDRHVTHNFAISAPPKQAFRFFHLRLTGKNHYGNDLLAICALELFGAFARE